MPKQKFRKIEQKQTFTKRSQYENALTRERAKTRARSLSYVEIDIGGGELANVYFLPLPGSVIKLREAGLDPLEAYKIMIGILSDVVVDPGTGQPIMSVGEWENEDPDFVGKITSAVMGIQFVPDNDSATETGTDADGNVIEVEIDDISEIASNPNPLDATPGSSSLTVSTSNSEAEDEKEPVTSGDG